MYFTSAWMPGWQLQKVIQVSVIVIAKVGSDNMYCDRAMGKHRCGTRNENGERL